MRATRIRADQQIERTTQIFRQPHVGRSGIHLARGRDVRVREVVHPNSLGVQHVVGET